MWLAFFITVLVYLVIGLGVCLWLRSMLNGWATFIDCCTYVIAWPAVLAVAAFHYWDE